MADTVLRDMGTEVPVDWSRPEDFPDGGLTFFVVVDPLLKDVERRGCFPVLHDEECIVLLTVLPNPVSCVVVCPLDMGTLDETETETDTGTDIVLDNFSVPLATFDEPCILTVLVSNVAPDGYPLCEGILEVEREEIPDIFPADPLIPEDPEPILEDTDPDILMDDGVLLTIPLGCLSVV